MRGTVFPFESRTYLILPFCVEDGTKRLKVAYHYWPLRPALPQTLVTQTVLDLGLWDERGYRSAAGFRGWSGSRHKEVEIEAGSATRCYRAGPIQPGTWYVELGLAAVGLTGAEWEVEVEAFDGPSAAPPDPRPVDPGYVANEEAGWYHGDFHMHSWHSNPQGPSRERFLQIAEDAGLDFTPVTEYVVGWHWDEYGDIQKQYPRILIWPGREIITYFGHMQCIGETPGFVEYRHGFEGVKAQAIQDEVHERGALFQVNHPTTFKGALWRNLCRGCAFDLSDEIDWGKVDTIEVLTGDALLHRKLLFRNVRGEIENPFMASAVEFWEALLNAGYRVTAVCGSDAKKGKGLGTCATAVYASRLSRDALTDAIRAGRAYVRTRGVANSPTIEMAASTPDGQEGGFGSTLVLPPGGHAFLRVVVHGGAGESMRVIRNGVEVAIIEVETDDFLSELEIARASQEGPLGTWWRVETFDERSRTTIGNPIFLRGTEAREAAGPVPRLPTRCQFRRSLAAHRRLGALPHIPDVSGT